MSQVSVVQRHLHSENVFKGRTKEYREGKERRISMEENFNYSFISVLRMIIPVYIMFQRPKFNDKSFVVGLPL